MATKEGIAVIAVAGNFPANLTADKYWERLTNQSTPIQRHANSVMGWRLPAENSRSAKTVEASYRESPIRFSAFSPPLTAVAKLWAALASAGYTGQRVAGRLAAFGDLAPAARQLLNNPFAPLRIDQIVTDVAVTPETAELLSKFPPDLRNIALACWYLSNDFCDLAIAGGEIALALKRMDAAIADGDAILAVIEELYVASDGRSNRLVKPTENGNAANRELIGISQNLPGKTLVYSELAAPDPHSSQSRMSALRAPAGEPLWEDAPDRAQAASPGINRLAAFTKLLFALHYRQIPPGLWTRKVSAFQSTDVEKFHQNPELRSWLSLGNDRRGGAVFSFDGAAMQFALAEPASAPAGLPRHWQVVTFSGETEGERAAEMHSFSNYFQKHANVDIADLAYSLQTGRHAFARRASMVVQDSQQCARISASPSLRGIITNRMLSDRPRVAFMFPGNGGAYLGMAQEIYENEPFFAQRIDEYAEHISELAGMDICRIISPDVSQFEAELQLLQQPPAAHLALLAVEIALAGLLQNWAVKPDVLIGHDSGEMAALVVGGCLPAETAFRLAAVRSRILTANAADAALVARLTQAAAINYLRPDVKIAAVHSSETLTFAGAASAIASIEQQLNRQKIWHRRIPGDWCSHSIPVACETDEIRQIIENTDIKSPKIPIFSAITGDFLKKAHIQSSEYWFNQLVLPVRFGDGLAKLFADDISVFLEVGPGSNLCSAVRLQEGAPRPLLTLETMAGFMVPHGDEYALMRALASVWTEGAAIDWVSFYENERRMRLHLPVLIPERLQVKVES